MIKMLSKIFKKVQENPLPKTHTADLALRLMFEIAISDGSLDPLELKLLKSRANDIASEGESSSAVLKKIIDETEQSTSLYPTVKKINEAYSKDQKLDLLQALWELVAADKVIDVYEENLYFKIAELIRIKRNQANQIKQKNS
jgi:uncharacterized tellurite resistance protein B-like protein